MKLLSNEEAVKNLPDSHFVDNRIYVDQQIFEMEKEKLFGRIWNFACLESEVSEPGDYRAITLFGGLPIIISRQKDGTLRAFYNVCTHRGARLTQQPSGNCKVFQCPYHLWTFNIDGSLQGITRPEGYEGVGLCRDKLDLTGVKVDSIFGLVFVSLNNEIEPLRKFLGDDFLKHLEGPFGTEKLEVFHYHRAVLEGNWTHWNDNNTEMYHAWLHYFNRRTTKAISGETDQRWYLYNNAHHVYRSASGQEAHAYDKANVELHTQNLFPTMNPNESLLISLFPNIMLNLRSTVLRIDNAIPLSPGKTLIEYRGVGLKSDTSEVRAMRIKHHNVLWGPFGRNLPEDIIAVESQRKGMETGALKYSLYAREEARDSNEVGLKPQDDGNVRNFYREWSTRMGIDASNPIV